MGRKQTKKPQGAAASGGKNALQVESSGPTGKQAMTVEVPASSRDDVMRRQVVWRFSDVDHDCAWSFDKLDGAALCAFLTKLGSFETMSVRELFYRGDYPGKQYDVPDLPKHALDQLVAIGRADETKLSVLRVMGAERLYGFLRDHVFHVLWWDPEHEVYPSVKKHT